MSQPAPFVRVAVDGPVATLTLAREPVNGMNLELWTQLGAALAALEADPAVRAVVLASGLARDVFTAGNDLSELYAPGTTQARYTAFWLAQTRCLARLLVSPLVAVAALRGACPAGGCVLALCCDARLATPTVTLGLNEVALGLPVPLFWARRFAAVAAGGGAARAETLLTTAALLPARDALAAGLVDAVVPAGELLGAARAECLRRLAAGPDGGRAATKRALRGGFAAGWEAHGPAEAEAGWAGLSDPLVVAALGASLARLSKKGGPPAPPAKL